MTHNPQLCIHKVSKTPTTVITYRSVGSVLEQVKTTHADFTKVTRVVLVHQNTVVVLPPCVTATGRVLSVLSDTTVTGGHITTLLTVLRQTGRLCGQRG